MFGLLKFLIKIALFFFVIWAAGYAYFIHVTKTMQPDEEFCQVLVVLTGSAGRIETGFKLLEEGRAPRLFITGVEERNQLESFLSQYKITPKFRRILEKPGVFSIDRKAKSTYDNAEQTKLWLATENNLTFLCLVTANYHMQRSLLVFKEAMPDKVFRPIPIDSSDVDLEDAFSPGPDTKSLITEYNKYLAANIIAQLSKFQKQ